VITNHTSTIVPLWRRADETLGRTTIQAIFRRAIALTARQYPVFAFLDLTGQGLDQESLAKFYQKHAEQKLSVAEFDAALDELTKWAKTLLSEMISVHAATKLFFPKE
jgi:hypothetical protein